MKTKDIHFKIEEELYEKVRRFTFENHTTIGAYVRRLIAQDLDPMTEKPTNPDETWELVCPTCSNAYFNGGFEDDVLICTGCGTWHNKLNDSWYLKDGTKIWSPFQNPNVSGTPVTGNDEESPVSTGDESDDDENLAN